MVGSAGGAGRHSGDQAGEHRHARDDRGQVEPLLGRVRVPTLVVAGADDQVTPVAHAEELARGIAGARLEVVAQAGHQAPLEQAETFNRLLAGFAEELP